MARKRRRRAIVEEEQEAAAGPTSVADANAGLVSPTRPVPQTEPPPLPLLGKLLAEAETPDLEEEGEEDQRRQAYVEVVETAPSPTAGGAVAQKEGAAKGGSDAAVTVQTLSIPQSVRDARLTLCVDGFSAETKRRLSKYRQFLKRRADCEVYVYGARCGSMDMVALLTACSRSNPRLYEEVWSACRGLVIEKHRRLVEMCATLPRTGSESRCVSEAELLRQICQHSLTTTYLAPSDLFRRYRGSCELFCYNKSCQTAPLPPPASPPRGTSDLSSLVLNSCLASCKLAWQAAHNSVVLVEEALTTSRGPTRSASPPHCQ